MEELLKALGPWPLVQGIVIGFIVAAIGTWAVRRGFQDSKKNGSSIEDIKSKWEMQKAIINLQDNSFDMVKLLERGNEIQEQQLAAINRIFDTRWNSKQK